MIEPGTDDAKEQAQGQGVPGVIGVLASALGLDGGYVGGEQSPAHDEDAVPVHGKRTNSKSDRVHKQSSLEKDVCGNPTGRKCPCIIPQIEPMRSKGA